MRLDSIRVLPGTGTATRVTQYGSSVIRARVAYQADAFAAALQGHTSAAVTVDDSAELVASDNTMFVCAQDVLFASLASDAGQARALASRTIVFDVVRTYALQWAERYSLAAVVETRSYLNWQGLGDTDAPAGLYGWKEVATAFGATWLPGSPFEGARYALLSHPQVHDLPGLIAAYLDAYARMLPDG